MSNTMRAWVLVLPCLVGLRPVDAAEPKGITLSWAKNMLTIRGEFPGKEISIHYLEAYCRPGSTDRDWRQTVIPHKTELVEATPDGKTIKLRCKLEDGVVAEHVITAGADEVDFKLTAHNPTKVESQAHWGQPCMRVDRFVGAKPVHSSEEYLSKSFIFLDGKPAIMPTRSWAKKARYVPGQVWAPKGVNRDDVNPRPLSDLVPSNGLIGCYSADDSMILASAWEPYQELFQGVIVCLHSDFRLGGLKPGETKTTRGKVYVVKNDIPALLRRYEKDFPEHVGK